MHLKGLFHESHHIVKLISGCKSDLNIAISPFAFSGSIYARTFWIDNVPEFHIEGKG